MISSTTLLADNADPEFTGLKTNQDQYKDNYQFGVGYFCRRIFLKHTVLELLQIRSRVKQIERLKQEEEKEENLQYSDVANIKYEDNSIDLTKSFDQQIQNLFNEISEDELTSNLIMKLLYRQFTSHIFFIVFLCLLEYASRLAFSVLLNLLLVTILELNDENSSIAYLLAFFTGFLWFIGQIARHNTFYQSPLLTAKIRSTLITLLFKKITKFSQYTVKSQQLGKIINMISNDFNMIQLKAPLFFSMLISPLVLIGVIIILVFRLGWTGVIPAIVTLILVPLQLYVGKVNGVILTEVNVYKDQRVKICTQIIEGVKFIKLYGWEIAFKKIIQELRKTELKNYIKLSFGRSLERALATASAAWAGFICFLIMYYTGEGEVLTTANIFSTLQILVTLRMIIFFAGLGGGFYFQLVVILDRFANIFNIKEKRMIKINEQSKEPIEKNHDKVESYESMKRIKDEEIIEFPPVRRGQIKLINFNGYWKSDDLERTTLKNINLHIKKGEFCGVTGKIGSGKSGLLGVLLEEIPYYSGEVQKYGSVVYVEQEPVIFSATIKENILFGAEMNSERYTDALKKSCLEADLELFQDGENTIVGEKGITLSGGQKARLALARALFIDADIYLFDDPISAVDSKVAKKIYENVMLQMRQEKTIILVTHQISYLFECDRVVIMNDGEIVHNDDPDNLKEELIKIEKKKGENEEEEEMDEEEKKIQEALMEEERLMKLEQVRRRKSSMMQKESEKGSVHKISGSKKEENVSVNCQTYTNYIFFSKINYFLFPLSIFLFLFTQAFNVLYVRFLAGFNDLNAGNHDVFQDDVDLYWGLLGTFVFCYFLFSIVKYFIVYLMVLSSNEDLHEEMIHGLVRSPSSFFDLTPTGQLTNKFSNDLGILDNTLAFTLVDTMQGPIITIVMLVNIFAIDLFFLIPGCLSIIFFIAFFIFCKETIVQTKQLDLRLKSPVFSMVNEIVSGLIQIKIFNRRGKLLQQFTTLVDRMLRGTASFWICSRAFGTYISYVALLITIIGFLLGISNIENSQDETSKASKAGLYGVSVIFLLQINDYLQWFLRQIINMQSIMVSVERSFLVKDLKPEKQLLSDYDESLGINGNPENSQKKGGSGNDDWPSHASLKVNNFSMRYRPELPLVLKNISFSIQEGEKVGIVGRTGAGKSSIIQALFRIIQPEIGSAYEMDNADALKLGLHTLRQRISVIPQTPFLFKGSIKTNLDPFHEKDEEELWKVLEESGLKEAVEKMDDKLQTNISNVSEVFSVGQKQLLCLARALIRKNKFLVLDEATSNVDMQTDHFIQNCIHNRFAETTVITIAHRLNTIADYDKIIVMDRGRIIEIGSPHELICKNGLFAEMVNHTGRNADLIKKIAKETHERPSKSPKDDGFIQINVI